MRTNNKGRELRATDDRTVGDIVGESLATDFPTENKFLEEIYVLRDRLSDVGDWSFRFREGLTAAEKMRPAPDQPLPAQAFSIIEVKINGVVAAMKKATEEAKKAMSMLADARVRANRL